MGSNSSGKCGDPFGAMAMPHGPVCNLDCDYCYYLDKLSQFADGKEDPDYRMNDDILEEYIHQYIEAFPGDTVHFAWQGGEPTLAGIDFYRKVIQLQEQHSPATKTIVNSLQTNGTLLDEQWGEFLSEHDFLVGISLDGPQNLHNAYRTQTDGKGSFEQVMNGLRILKEFDVEYNVLCTVNSINVKYPLKVYEFFKENDITWIQFIPIVEETDSESEAILSEVEVEEKFGPLNDRSTYGWVEQNSTVGDAHSVDNRHIVREHADGATVSAETAGATEYGDFLKTIFDTWIRNDIGELSVQIFDEAIKAWDGTGVDLCVFDETCGDQVVVEHSGDVYSCDHFVEPAFKLGNLTETHLNQMAHSSEQQEFGEYKKTGLPDYCKSCDVRFVCNGGCPKNRLLKTPSGETGLNYLCPDYKSFFSYIDPYMKIIENTINKGEQLAVVRQKVSALDKHFDQK